MVVVSAIDPVFWVCHVLFTMTLCHFSITLVIVTPFLAASLVETVQVRRHSLLHCHQCCQLLFSRYNDVLVESLFFHCLYPCQSCLKPLQGVFPVTCGMKFRVEKLEFLGYPAVKTARSYSYNLCSLGLILFWTWNMWVCLCFCLSCTMVQYTSIKDQIVLGQSLLHFKG